MFRSLLTSWILDGTIDVPEDKLSALNYSTTVDYMRTPAEEGGGIEATVEIFHQLHCLVSNNLLDNFSEDRTIVLPGIIPPPYTLKANSNFSRT